MMIGKLLAFTAFCICKVYTQHYPVAIPCHQRGVPISASPPVFANVRALTSPISAAAPVCPSLAKANIVVQKQQLAMPLEYALASPATLPQPLPVPALTASASCYHPLPNSVPCTAEFVVPNCLNDICTAEPVFDIFGCLDPILSCYGTIAEVPIPEVPTCLPLSYLPAASPTSILPPVLSSECSCHFLKKIAIPPPFI